MTHRYKASTGRIFRCAVNPNQKALDELARAVRYLASPLEAEPLLTRCLSPDSVGPDLVSYDLGPLRVQTTQELDTRVPHAAPLPATPEDFVGLGAPVQGIPWFVAAKIPAAPITDPTKQCCRCARERHGIISRQNDAIQGLEGELKYWRNAAGDGPSVPALRQEIQKLRDAESRTRKLLQEAQSKLDGAKEAGFEIRAALGLPYDVPRFLVLDRARPLHALGPQSDREVALQKNLEEACRATGASKAELSTFGDLPIVIARLVNELSAMGRRATDLETAALRDIHAPERTAVIDELCKLFLFSPGESFQSLPAKVRSLIDRVMKANKEALQSGDALETWKLKREGLINCLCKELGWGTIVASDEGLADAIGALLQRKGGANEDTKRLNFAENSPEKVLSTFNYWRSLVGEGITSLNFRGAIDEVMKEAK